jgi:hypothetical protein
MIKDMRLLVAVKDVGAYAKFNLFVHSTIEKNVRELIEEIDDVIMMD